MRQAVMVSPGNIEMRMVPAPKQDAKKVLVQISYVGICGSDIHVYHGKHPYTSYPVIQGHEVSGVVVSAGDSREFHAGDKVTFEPQVSCGTCRPCRNGMYNICNELKVMGFQTEGAACEYVSVDPSRLVTLPDSFSLQHGAMIEPLAVAVRAAGKAGSLRGASVLVLGAGPIGNLTAQTAKAKGASKVMITDVNSLKITKALECGIDFGVNVLEENLEHRMHETFGKADVIFDCAGVQSSIDSAVSLAQKGSDIIVVAVFGGKPEVDLARINECELNIIGTARYVKDDFRAAVRLVEEKNILLDPLVSHIFSFHEFSKAYQTIDKEPEQVMKVLIRIDSNA